MSIMTVGSQPSREEKREMIDKENYSLAVGCFNCRSQTFPSKLIRRTVIIKFCGNLLAVRTDNRKEYIQETKCNTSTGYALKPRYISRESPTCC